MVTFESFQSVNLARKIAREFFEFGYAERNPAMGVKSSIQLTRRDAEERFRIMVIRAYGDDWIAGLPDDVLAEQLTFVDDHLHGGESFNNYYIVPDWLVSDPKDDR